MPPTGYRALRSWIGRAGPDEAVEDLEPRHAEAVDLPVPHTPAGRAYQYQPRQEPQRGTVRLVTRNPTEPSSSSDFPRRSIPLPSDPSHHYMGERDNSETTPMSTTQGIPRLPPLDPQLRDGNVLPYLVQIQSTMYGLSKQRKEKEAGYSLFTDNV